MKLFEIFKRKQAHWNVFNTFELLEFAECSRCGAEVEPDFTYFPHTIYPLRCPCCGAEMTHSEAVS